MRLSFGLGAFIAVLWPMCEYFRVVCGFQCILAYEFNEIRGHGRRGMAKGAGSTVGRDGVSAPQ